MSDEQDLMRQIASAGAHIDPGLSDRDVERLVEGSRRRRRRRKVGRIACATIVGCAGITALVLLVHSRPHPSNLAVAPRPAAPRVAPGAKDETALRFSDGSLATKLDPGSEIEVAEESQLRIGLNLIRGRGRFEVTPRPQRTFAVRAGEVSVTVVGTVFTVERVADRVGVSVERGTVRVDWGVGLRLLGKGESGWFPPLVVEAPSVTRLTPPVRPVHGHPTRSVAMVASSDGKPVVSAVARKSQTAEELFVAADAARLAGHANEGAGLLRTLLQDHRSDPRAPLAAFTLGRMLLMELGRPREAAWAFSEVRQLAPRGSFAEDALAREAEAWSQAGQADLARARAQEYLRLYPGGRRTHTVKSVSGIE